MAGARAGAEIMDKGGTGVGAENKQFRLRNTGIDSDAALVLFFVSICLRHYSSLASKALFKSCKKSKLGKLCFGSRQRSPLQGGSVSA